MLYKLFSSFTLIFLGAAALLQTLGISYFGLTLWSGLLLLVGLQMTWGSLFNGWYPSLFGAALGLGVAGYGLLQTMANLGLSTGLTLSDMLHLSWPLLLIALGLSLLVGRRRCHWHWDWD